GRWCSWRMRSPHGSRKTARQPPGRTPPRVSAGTVTPRPPIPAVWRWDGRMCSKLSFPLGASWGEPTSTLRLIRTKTIRGGERVEGITLLQGDCLELLKDIPDGSVDMVLCDPPYSSGGLFAGDRKASTRTKYCDGDYNGA